MKKLAIAALLACSAYASPAAAQSAFNGFHIGANVGAGIGDLDMRQFGGQSNLDSLGIVGGVSGGYMMTFAQSWVLDVEGIFDYSTAKTTGNLFSNVKQGIGYGGAVSAGYLINQSTLLFGKVGYMSSDFKIDGGGSKQDGGILFGGGVRYAVSDNWSIKGEYDFTDYSKINDASTGLGVQPFVNTFRIGADYKFGNWSW